jgi:hypothetical protein
MKKSSQTVRQSGIGGLDYPLHPHVQLSEIFSFSPGGILDQKGQVQVFWNDWMSDEVFIDVSLP